MPAHNFIDLSGQVYGRLTVIRQAERLRSKVPRWLCVCECGSEVVVEGKNLRHGMTRSCGCLCVEATGARSRTHGLTDSPEYKVWCGIKRRCYNQNEPCYPRYGGAGVTVCDRWRHSFVNFLSDMGPRPSEKHSIERVNPRKGYEPGNCKWMLLSEQPRNRRNTIYLTHAGQTKLMLDWAAEVGLPYPAMKARLLRGWSDSQIITTPIMENRRNRNFINR